MEMKGLVFAVCNKLLSPVRFESAVFFFFCCFFFKGTVGPNCGRGAVFFS